MDVSVSQLVRRALQRTVDMVGNLSGNVEHLVQEVVADVQNITNVTKSESTARDLRANPLLDRVVGWQAIKNQRRTRCALTAEPIEPGADAYASVNADAAPPLVISSRAFDMLTEPRGEQWSELVITQPMPCLDTQKIMQSGDKAWLRVGSKPPEIICQAAYLKRKSG